MTLVSIALRGAGLGITALLISCGPSPLLDDVGKQIEKAKQMVAAPSINPPSGVFRNVMPSNVTIAGPSGARLLYTVDGSKPLFNANGEVQSPTFRSLTPLSLPTFVGPGTLEVRAQAWKGGKVSSETKATYSLVGNGGTIWSKSQASKKVGGTYATLMGSDGSRYTGGQIDNGNGVMEAFLTKWSETGEVIWSQRVHSTTSSSSSRIEGIALDSSTGNVYVVGTMVVASRYYFTSKPLIVFNGDTWHPAAFVASYTPDGTWTKAMIIRSAISSTALHGISAGSGNLYIVGGTSAGDGNSVPGYSLSVIAPNVPEYSPTAQPPALAFVKTGAAAFIWKLDMTLQYLNSAAAVSTDPTDDTFSSVTFSSVNYEVIVGGSFKALGSTDLEYGAAGAALPGDQDYTLPLVVAFDGALNPQWQTSATVAHVGTDNPTAVFGRVNAVAIDTNGNVVVGGEVSPASRMWTWRATQLAVGYDAPNGFVAYFDNGELASSFFPFNSTLDSSIRGLSVDEAANFYAVGSMTMSAGKTPAAVKMNSGLSPEWYKYGVASQQPGAYFSVSHGPNSLDERVMVGGAKSAGADFSSEMFD